MELKSNHALSNRIKSDKIVEKIKIRCKHFIVSNEHLDHDHSSPELPPVSYC